ncbi:MAG: XdhC/CoxI family protein [Flavobacterium sp.]|uniref:XdhC family protein n=1 Tax=Flavobacterium sp. TaxID=239 RepID=UPI00121666FC|nr:XdhC/CoxI family protein [Flavobacterium sp.]RZJ64258.1 MAG: XdhC/CoxI family protein [Flavobacterium sp.]
MKEINDILEAYFFATATQKKCALATVVKVEGSSYRQPGARMLVTQDGMLTGAISGGCLEGDALRKALLCIDQQQNKLITYDTSSDDDAEFGVQLGCNGIVHILFEFIDETNPKNPISLLKRLQTERQAAAIAVVFSTDRNQSQPGTSLFFRSESNCISSNDIGQNLIAEAQSAIKTKSTKIITNNNSTNNSEALIEFIPPPTSLIVAGAGNDVQPLAKAASLLGWETTIADGRSSHAKQNRFPEAKSVLVAKPLELIEKITIDSNTYFALMTHNYKYDLALLKLLLETDIRYIGILGPKTKLDRMLLDLESDGIKVTSEQLSRIYAPIGLDIGAETSEEIAISIVSEIKAVMTNRKGGLLKFKTDKIHAATVA